MAMMLKPKSKSEVISVPDGSYRATLTKVTQFNNVYGLRVGFEFSLHGNGVEGKLLMRSTNSVLTAKSKLAEIIEGVMGRELSSDEIKTGFDVDKLIGKECNVLVLNSKSKNGAIYSNVEKIFQAAECLSV